MLLAFLVFIGLSSSVAASPNGEQKSQNDTDSLAFYIGMAQSNGLLDYLKAKMNVDTKHIADFKRGLSVGAYSINDPAANAFYAGVQIGQQISGQMVKGINTELFGDDSDKSISLNTFLEGFLYGMEHGSDAELMEDASQKVQVLMEKVKESNISVESKAYKEKNEKWLAENSSKPGVHTTPSGLQYKVIRKGNGKVPAEDSEIACHYEGRLIDGTVFDSSYKRKETAKITVNQVIKGWTEALCMMPAGSIWEIYVPQHLAYGSREAGEIKPFSTLIFRLELISVKR